MNDLPWFQSFTKSSQYGILKKKPLAYFCIEYALSPDLPTYAGGLGVLAGDYVRELADQHIPAVAVGLYYQSNYGSEFSEQKPISLTTAVTPEQQGLIAVLNSSGQPIYVEVPMHDHTVFAKVWKWQKGTIPIYLLDTNIPENQQVDRAICYKLYDSNKEVRLKQEMLLGIGGFRLLEELGIQPSIYHMNEGHSSLMLLELVRHEMRKRKIGFKDAVSLAAHHVVFTNHTLLASGHEIYSNELFSTMLSQYASELEVPVADIISLGLIADSNSFSLSLFALRLAGRINAVSKLHAVEAAKAWVDYTVHPVTNGVHVPTWNTITDGAPVVSAHLENKRKLLAYIKDQTGTVWSENALVIGWARRMVSYKRPLALFGEIERLKLLVEDAQRPIRIVISGIAHQGDVEGREFIRRVQEIIRNHLFGDAVYLPHYSITLSKLLVSGCDVWLNTPVVGSEACGTSGMKASLNGTLACSTKDGWMDEADLTQIGWALKSDTIHDDILTVIEEEMIPEYYASPRTVWEKKMQNSRNLVLNDFSATRMLKDYFTEMYIPIMDASTEHYLESH